MHFLTQIIIGIGITFFAFTCSFFYWKKQDGDTLWLMLFLGVSFISELAAGIWNIKFGNNLWIYHLTAPFLAWFIFNYLFSIDRPLKGSHFWKWLPLLFFFFAGINIHFWQPLRQINSNAVLFNSMVLIGFAARSSWSHYRMLLQGETTDLIQFLILLVLILFYVESLFFWGVLPQYKKLEPPRTRLESIYSILFFFNLLCYSCWGLLFIHSMRHNTKNHEQR